MSVLGRPTWAIFNVNLHQRVTALPTTAQTVGEGLKIWGDDFMIKFKLMKNTFSVYLDIFNTGLLLIIDQGHLATQ